MEPSDLATPVDPDAPDADSPTHLYETHGQALDDAEKYAAANPAWLLAAFRDSPAYSLGLRRFLGIDEDDSRHFDLILADLRARRGDAA